VTRRPRLLLAGKKRARARDFFDREMEKYRVADVVDCDKPSNGTKAHSPKPERRRDRLATMLDLSKTPLEGSVYLLVVQHTVAELPRGWRSS
jgi:hypothetical protein